MRSSRIRHGLGRVGALFAFVAGSACEEAPPPPDVHAERLTPRQIEDTLVDLTGYRSPELDALPGATGDLPPMMSTLDVEIMRAVAEDTAWTMMVDIERWAPCHGGEDAHRCAAEFIDRFGSKALRAPVPPETRATLLAMFDRLLPAAGYTRAVQAVAEVLLQSPRLLYRIETTVHDEEGTPRIDALSIAARLSYFVWGSTPDDALLQAAASGEVLAAEGRGRQIDRMLDDPRAQRTFIARVRDWMSVDLEGLTKDPTVFPAFDQYTPLSMGAQIDFFLKDAGWGPEGSFHRLLTDPVGLQSEPERRGILLLPGFLATHATPNSTSPVLRGKLVLERLLCESVSPPPPGLDISIPPPGPDTTTRERFERHGKEEPCASCHQRLDPLGFAFESYDGIGARRMTENGHAIDATGVIRIAGGTELAFDGATSLLDQLDESGVAARCWARHWSKLALGPQADDRALEEIEARFLSEGTRTTALFRAIAESEAFVRPIPSEESR